LRRPCAPISINKNKSKEEIDHAIAVIPQNLYIFKKYAGDTSKINMILAGVNPHTASTTKNKYELKLARAAAILGNFILLAPLQRPS
jgi:hypothetical protein